MTLPYFLIIGAMKAGTTTLFRDLAANPQVFFPGFKEPKNLADDAVLTDQGRADYARLFNRAGHGQVCGEASTAYTKLPEITGVAERARRVLGSGVKVVYLVREPVSRTISQHYHEVTTRRMTDDINEAVRTAPRLIDQSRYAMQLAPWLDQFGPDHVRVVRFETYVRDRRGVIESVSRFLGIDPRPDLIEPDRAFNISEGKPALVGMWRLMRHNPIYKHLVRPIVPQRSREVLGRLLLPQAPARPDPPSLDTVDYILDRVRDDAETLRKFIGADKPLWDFDAIRRKYAEAKPDDAPSASGSSGAASGQV